MLVTQHRMELDGKAKKERSKPDEKEQTRHVEKIREKQARLICG